MSHVKCASEVLYILYRHVMTGCQVTWWITQTKISNQREIPRQKQLWKYILLFTYFFRFCLLCPTKRSKTFRCHWQQKLTLKQTKSFYQHVEELYPTFLCWCIYYFVIIATLEGFWAWSHVTISQLDSNPDFD